MTPAAYLAQIETLRESVKNLQAAIREDEYFAGQAKRIRIRNAIAQRLDYALNALYEIDVELANLPDRIADDVKYPQ